MPISGECVGIGGSVVECSPATRAARVRFPADAIFKLAPRRCQLCSDSASTGFFIRASSYLSEAPAPNAALPFAVSLVELLS